MTGGVATYSAHDICRTVGPTRPPSPPSRRRGLCSSPFSRPPRRRHLPARRRRRPPGARLPRPRTGGRRRELAAPARCRRRLARGRRVRAVLRLHQGHRGHRTRQPLLRVRRRRCARRRHARRQLSHGAPRHGPHAAGPRVRRPTAVRRRPAAPAGARSGEGRGPRPRRAGRLDAGLPRHSRPPDRSRADPLHLPLLLDRSDGQHPPLRRVPAVARRVRGLRAHAARDRRLERMAVLAALRDR